MYSKPFFSQHMYYLCKEIFYTKKYGEKLPPGHKRLRRSYVRFWSRLSNRCKASITSFLAAITYVYSHRAEVTVPARTRHTLCLLFNEYYWTYLSFKEFVGPAIIIYARFLWKFVFDSLRAHRHRWIWYPFLGVRLRTHATIILVSITTMLHYSFNIIVK